MRSELFSIRMRAAEGGAHEDGGKHISGAEALVEEKGLEKSVLDFLSKARTHTRGTPDFLQISVEKVATHDIRKIETLPVRRFDVSSIAEGREKAAELLKRIRISKVAIDNAFHHLLNGPTHRGAILVEAHSGERMDARGLKGIRVSRFGWNSDAALPANGRIRDAMAIASKVASSPFSVAELCWSDDPDYTAGYVSSGTFGYMRVSRLKEIGCETGGRVFFILPNTDVDDYIRYLEKCPVLISTKGREL
ncbi:6-carboxyhexanoate--CoA ligase [Sporosarcina sp. 179-K 3D1 HS]|uniref:6-carboxyhexanoate--CoA ligase n=1 Tax=Sporosarcina sp. 179-K 3D1 HS TaxID=3232169 RepID=UPI0039A24F86